MKGSITQYLRKVNKNLSKFDKSYFQIPRQLDDVVTHFVLIFEFFRFFGNPPLLAGRKLADVLHGAEVLRERHLKILWHIII